VDRFSVFPAFDSSATGNNRAPSKPDEGRGFKEHSARFGESRGAGTRRISVDTLLDDLNFQVLSGGMLR